MDDAIEAALGRWLAAMLAYDVDAVMRCCHPQIRLGLHFGDVPLPFVGETHGSHAARRRTQQMFASWRFPSTDFNVVAINGDEVRALLFVTIQHRWTGFSIDTKIRQSIRFEGGLIREFDGYMDAPRFNAFLRFVGIAPTRTAVRSGE